MAEAQRPLHAVLFDVDGTLAETEEVHRQAFNRAFGAAGLGWHWDPPLYRELLAVSGGRERLAHYLQAFRPPVPPHLDPEPLIAALHRDKTRAYADLIESGGIALRPGVERLLRELRGAGRRLAIVTTTSAANLAPLLRATLGTEALGWFEVVCTAEQAPVKKPAPDAYLWTLERLQLPAHACLAIEDTANGVAAARAAGVPVVVTRSRYSEGEDFAGAVAVLSDLGEPGQAFEVLAGSPHGGSFADLRLLETWHAEASAA